MEKELQESEVIFPENAETNSNFSVHYSNSRELSKNKPNRKKKKKKMNSVRVNIPQTFCGNSWFRCVESGIFHDQLIPPHLILGRRIGAEMAFSVYKGNGRTQKGRGLSEMRNSIMR
ncbi:protein S40-1-like [Cornus florida]|uniref:protein S40-1-like n=1 Tax=Cornus florida TaxID=4283 RepID=UPI0028A22680|nr:protein S40-1-like [Cornus florida]